MAAVHPITPPAWRGLKIIGICLKVEALPTPVKKKMTIMPQKKAVNWSAESGATVVAVKAAAMAIPRVDDQRDSRATDPVGDRAGDDARC